MAHTDSVQESRINWRLISSWVVFIAGFASAVYSYMNIGDAMRTDAWEMNPGMDASSYYLFASIGASIGWVVLAFVAMARHEKNENDLLANIVLGPFSTIEDTTDGFIHGIVAVCMPLALIPAVCGLALTFTPYTVATPEGGVRFTQDGQLLVSGETFTSTRTMPQSVFIPFRHQVTVTHTVALGDGLDVDVTVTAIRRLNPDTLRPHILGYAHALGLGENPAREWGNSFYNDQAAAQQRFFAQADTAHLHQAIDAVVREAAATGTMSETGMLLRLGELVDASDLPEWEVATVVQSIKVSGLTLTR